MLTKRCRFYFGVSISATPVLLETSMSLTIPKVEYMTRIAVGIFWNTFRLWLAHPTSITIQNLAILVKHDLKRLRNY
ncbi:hypothetical protein [Limosilactobacillus coleohominis]|nr:hypothetical protein [Limosilactobacillus coleohominis]